MRDPAARADQPLWGAYYPQMTTGWSPSCRCPEAPPVPCVVGDIFCGSGTSGAVARALGLDFVGVECSPAYAKMARERIAAVNPVLDAEDHAPARPSQGSLFDTGGEQ